MKILYLGASGLLGKNLVPLLRKNNEVITPIHEIYDIVNNQYKYDCDLVINSVAYTNVERAEIERRECFEINTKGVLNLLEVYKDKPFVQISTEYCHNPINFYSLTKSMAEQLVTTHPNYLIIRTLFKERPWKYPYAFKDKFTLGDYVDVIAEKIDKEIENWDRQSKMIYIGTGRKTYYDLARETRPDVIANSIREIKGVKIPSDYR